MLRATAIAIIAVATAAWAGAATLDDLYFGGFVSQGYINTSHNNYLVTDSRDGSSEYHEAALSVMTRPGEHLRVGMQFLARDFGEIGNNHVWVDWAYADYQWQDYMGFLVGKFKTPQGLHGSGRDVDMLRPTVLLPQSVYNEAHRDFIMGVEGAGVYGNIPLDEGGGIDYQLYAGTLNVPDPSAGFWYDIMTEAGSEVAQQLNGSDDGSMVYAFSGIDDPKVRFQWLYGGSLFWNCPVSGLRLGVSLLDAHYSVDTMMRFDVTRDIAGETVHSTQYLHGGSTGTGEITVLSGEWTGDRVVLTAEYHQERVEGVTSEGFYGQASLAMSPRSTITTYYSRFLRDREDPGGDRWDRLGLPDYVGWQNDYCLALRVDPVDHLILKFEYHLIDGMGLLSLAHNDENDPDAFERWWSFLAAKATVHF